MKFSALRLRRLREQTGKSPEEVSQDIASKNYRITRNTLVNWEKGKTKPTVDDLERLARVYKCDLWSFFATNSNQST